MADDNRSNDRQDLDAMTRAFLANGGTIVQCPPGASDNVVYRKGTFRRRSPADAKPPAANGTNPPPSAAPAASAGSESAAD